MKERFHFNKNLHVFSHHPEGRSSSFLFDINTVVNRNLEGQLIRPIPKTVWCDGTINCPFGEDEDYDECLKGRDPNSTALNLKTFSYFKNKTLYERLYISNVMRRVVRK